MVQEHWHGTLNGYTNRCCRCAPCKAAWAAHRREYRQRKRTALLRQYVYFIEAGKDGPIKIGVTADPLARLNDLQTGNPFKLKVIGAVSAGVEREAALHKELAAWRMEREWFQRSEEVLAAMERELGRPGVTAWQPRPRLVDACENCGVKSSSYGSDGLCVACAEFAELRASGIDPFADAA